MHAGVWRGVCGEELPWPTLLRAPLHYHPLYLPSTSPSSLLFSVPANSSDSMYCMQLAQNAVHGAMAGYTGFCVGLINNRLVYIPMQTICDNSPRVMDPAGRWVLALLVSVFALMVAVQRLRSRSRLFCLLRSAFGRTRPSFDLAP